MDDTNNTATEILTTTKIGRRNAKVGTEIRRTAAYLRGCAHRTIGQLATDRGVIESIESVMYFGKVETRIMVRWTVGNLAGTISQAPRGIEVA